MTLYSCSHNVVQSFCVFSRCWFYCYVRLSGGFQLFCTPSVLSSANSCSTSGDYPFHVTSAPHVMSDLPLIVSSVSKAECYGPTCLIIIMRFPDFLSHCRWGVIAVLSFIIFHWCQLWCLSHLIA